MVYHHKRNETINGVYFKSTGLTMFFLPAPHRTIGIEMKQCGNCWGLLSTLGLTGRVGGASGGKEQELLYLRQWSWGKISLESENVIEKVKVVIGKASSESESFLFLQVNMTK